MDEKLQLAMLMHKNKGVYALLLGAGISSSAGIKTAHEIEQDLKERVRTLGDYTLDDERITYSKLLDILGPTAAERHSILRSYFEPTPNEHAHGIKVPSVAHHAIAELIERKYINLVITTNFDRLLEIALEERNIQPKVIHSDAELRTTTPIRHNDVTIVHLHGVYSDLNFLNTQDELQDYQTEKTKLLESVFAEYGIIVCGWSARSDTALRNIIKQTRSRWYTTFWVEPFDLSEIALDIIDYHQAGLIQEPANDFFPGLLRNIQALEKMETQELTVRVAVEQVKRYLPDDSNQIALEDVLRDETEREYEYITELSLADLIDYKPDDIHKAVEKICVGYLERISKTLNMFAVLCWYGHGQQTDMISNTLSRWASFSSRTRRQREGWRSIAPLLVMYTCGIAAVHRERWEYLRAALIEPTIWWQEQTEHHFLSEINKSTIVGKYFDPTLERDPFSDVIASTLRPIFQQYIRDDDRYYRSFEIFETLLAILCLDSTDQFIVHSACYPKYNRWMYFSRFLDKAGTKKEKWPFLTFFFDGSRAEFSAALLKYRTHILTHYAQDGEEFIPEYTDIFHGKKIGLAKLDTTELDGTQFINDTGLYGQSPNHSAVNAQ